MEEEIEIERCSGHCCRVFNLPITMEEIYGVRGNDFVDIEKVREMLILIDAAPFDYLTGELVNYCVEYFTCKHFNSETGNCMNYENRPQMCKQYPYGKKCVYEECTRKTKIISN